MKSGKIFFIVVVLIAVNLFIDGCGQKKDEQAIKQTQIEKKTDDKIVREGIIDVAAIDVNKDGKVYECPMDYNVIDDKPNTCPTCKMNLEEFTVAEVKENLAKTDYKVK
ncbi:MAG: hypothetical protein NTX22_10580 [Ignavibacteriales bacterium]|nr:hypothetical protein [Ignavibacteriales bacterium]